MRFDLFALIYRSSHTWSQYAIFLLLIYAVQIFDFNGMNLWVFIIIEGSQFLSWAVLKKRVIGLI